MKREFLKNMGLEDEVIDKILDENSRDIGGYKRAAETAQADLEAARKTLKDRESDLETLQKSAGDADAIRKQLEELQDKYDTDAKKHAEELAERDYSDAVSAAVADLKFSSKGARAAFVADLKAQKLEVKDGKLTGFDSYLKAAREADPEAFAPEKPRPAFTRPLSPPGGERPKSAGERMAAAMGQSDAARSKAASDIINLYTGGTN